MLSKITIDTAPNFKPCIKVSEVSSEDVRDRLVFGLRDQLKHKSNTFEIVFHGVSPDQEHIYTLHPVDDELMYIEKLVCKWLGQDNEANSKLFRIAKILNDALDNHEESQIEK